MALIAKLDATKLKITEVFKKAKMQHAEKGKAREQAKTNSDLLKAPSKAYHLLRTSHQNPFKTAMPTAKSKADKNTYIKKLMCAASAGKLVHFKILKVRKRRWI